MMRTEIRDVLFDVGRVLVELDGMPSLAAMLSAESLETLHDRWMGSPAVIAHETGQISEAMFAELVTAELSLPTTPDAFLEDFRNWPRSLHPLIMPSASRRWTR
jgi:hypothetical protein